MREILFRGKCVDSGEWVYGNLIEDKWGDDNGNTIYAILQDRVAPGIVELWTPVRVIPETVGQYTGLTDKNGKKIFEGDICGCFCNTQIFEVKYCKERCGYFLDDCVRSGDCEPAPECLGNLRNTMEVIGTIYDNPELLEAKE